MSIYFAAPLLDKPLFATTADDDLFEDCPRYGLVALSQVTDPGLPGELKKNVRDDFAADLRVAWTATGCYFRFDVFDDVPVVSHEGPLETLTGDSFQLILKNLTVGPGRSAAAKPWNLVLLPSPKEEKCKLFTDPAPLAGLQVKFFRDPTDHRRYSIVLEVPYATWESKPRTGGFLQLQVLYNDADTIGQPEHRFALVPPDSRGAANTFGKVHFVGDVWVGTIPRSVVWPGDTAELLVDAGNLTGNELEGEFYLRKMTAANQFEDFPGFAQKFPVSAHSAKQALKIKLDLKDVAVGTYDLRLKLGIQSAPGQLLVQKTADLVQFPALIEVPENKEVADRELDAYQKPELIKETFARLAGEGETVWSAGVYDGTAQEFATRIRVPGACIVPIPKTAAKDIPGTLFGGKDNLDGTGEPLVLQLDKSLFQGRKPLRPLLPEFDYLKSDLRANRAANMSTKLLLLGLIAEQGDGHGFPEIRVSAEGQEMLHETLRASASEPRGKRHVYVLRVWLNATQPTIQVENVSQFGNKVLLDFLALVDGGPEKAAAPAAPAAGGMLRFSGSGEADVFNRQLQTSLFLLENYLIDRRGLVYPSLPGGRYQEPRFLDYALLLNELACWGRLDRAAQLVQARQANAARTRAGVNQFTLADPATVTAFYNYWCKSGKKLDIINRAYAAHVQQPILRMVQELRTNQMGLVNAAGDLGVEDEGLRGTTTPMYFATRAALESASYLANIRGDTTDSETWARLLMSLDASFGRELVSPPGGQSITDPRAAGQLPERVWVYGRYEGGGAVAVSQRQPVFNGPCVLAGLPFHADLHGYTLAAPYDQQLANTLAYLRTSSPAMKGLTYSQYNVLDFAPSAGQLWCVMGDYLLDETVRATNLLNAYIRYSFDEYKDLPNFSPAIGSEIRVSPYTFREKLNINNKGQQLGPTGDDLNVFNGVMGLEVARFLAGVDDSDAMELRLLPRLPETWPKLEVQGWRANHDPLVNRTARLDVTYARIKENHYELAFKSDDKISSLRVRFGPFSLRTSNVIVVVGAESGRRMVPTVRRGDARWVEQNFRNVDALSVTVRSQF